MIEVAPYVDADTLWHAEVAADGHAGRFAQLSSLRELPGHLDGIERV